MKPIEKVRTVHAVLLVLLLLATFGANMWLHSMAYRDPTRRLWQPRIDAIGPAALCAVVVSWVGFYVYYFIVEFRRGLRKKQDS
jgi:hypothetical protein